MVLVARCWILGVLGAAALAACSTSLFDEHGTATGSSGGSLPVACKAPCLGDAAADFDGSPAGATGHWRYLDDHRDRTWTAMTGDASMRAGADAANHLTTCAVHPDAAACKQLLGALLISSAGATSAADPALELTAPTNQVLQLTVRAFVATGPDQQIRIYRNSREDVLVTATAAAGAMLEQTVTLDALAGDRLLVALAPTTAGATDVGLQMFANPTGAAFPAACQLAVTFNAAAMGNTIGNVCGSPFTHRLFQTDVDSPPALAAGPFPEQGMAGDFPADNYYVGNDVINRTHDTTLQFWIKHRAFVEPYDAWPFSDLDLDKPGGLGIAITNTSPVRLDIQTTTVIAKDIQTADALSPYPTDGGWHFVRVVHTGDSVYVCLDGKRQSSVVVPAGHLQSEFAPYFGANQRWTPQGGNFNGLLDDLRILNGALPCEPGT